MNKKKTYIFVAVILIVLILFGNKGMRSVITQRVMLGKLNKKFTAIETESRNLKLRLYNFENNPAYFEREARRKLGLIQPGEIKYKFVDKE
ncbi:MAG: septum formation initiator family protein [Elusimicrobiota bacterium]